MATSLNIAKKKENFDNLYFRLLLLYFNVHYVRVSKNQIYLVKQNNFLALKGHAHLQLLLGVKEKVIVQ